MKNDIEEKEERITELGMQRRKLEEYHDGIKLTLENQIKKLKGKISSLKKEINQLKDIPQPESSEEEEVLELKFAQ